MTTERILIMKSKKPVLISDTTFRDSHQSSFATRLRIEDMELVAEEMNRAGFYSMEVWGGATFDVCTRFLNEDPWERARILRRLLPDVKLTMLLRGQNLVGYRNYADDVVYAFVENAAEVGIDVFRVFDALNDERNFEAAFKAIKKAGKHIQGTISYSLTQPRLGGDIYNIDFYTKKAKRIVDMGADSICIKDMAGLLNPYDAFDLVTALKKAVPVPIQLHTHYTSGMASMTILKAVEAGVDIIDTCISTFGLRTSQPAIEPIVAALKDTDRDPGLNLDNLLKIAEKLESISPKYKKFLDNTKMAVIDTGVLKHQIPGGMATNLVSQLRGLQALDKLPLVYEELPRTRADLGYPPLVTPTSQMVGTQAVQNVLFGRYKIIPAQVKDYAYGLYGRPPVPINPEVQKMALKGYPRGEEPITCRAADMLEPEMEKGAKDIAGISTDVKDVLTYVLFPITGLKFLKWKYGLETPPEEVRPVTMEDVRREEEIVRKALSGEMSDKPVVEKTDSMREFNVFVNDSPYKVMIEEVGGSPVVSSVRRAAPAKPARKPEQAPAAPAPKPAPAPAKEPEAAKAPVEQLKAGAGDVEITAPMPGLLVRYEKKIGDPVAKDEPVVTIEAMKMQMALNAPEAGVVKGFNFSEGDSVEKNAVIAVISAK